MNVQVLSLRRPRCTTARAHRWTASVREYLSTGCGRRFSTEIYERERFSMKTYRKLVLFLQKSSKISGNLWEFMGKCFSRISVLQFPLDKLSGSFAGARVSLPATSKLKRLSAIRRAPRQPTRTDLLKRESTVSELDWCDCACCT